MELLDCIERIPSLLNKISSVERMNELSENLAAYVKDKKIRKIIFVASGTSLNAAKVTKYFAQNKCGLHITCAFPNVFLNYYDYLKPDVLYIFVSQGGNTKIVFQCLEKVRAAGYMNLSVTEDVHSIIAEGSELSVAMGSEHEEFMYRTIGYSTTVATCMMIEAIIGKINGTISDDGIQMIANDLCKAADSIPVITSDTLRWYKRNQFSLQRRSKCILAGAGYLWETADEANIKLMEMVPLMANSFELEELIHGPQNAFDDETIYFLLADRKFDKEKVEAIKKFITNEIGFCSIVGDVHTDERDMSIKYNSENFRMLEAITVFQVIAYKMASDRGRDLRRGVNSCIGDYIKKTI